MPQSQSGEAVFQVSKVGTGPSSQDSSGSKPKSAEQQNSTSNADPIAMLSADHRQVEKLFGDFEKANTAEQKSQLAKQVCLELVVHTLLEEEIFYPACQGHMEKRLLDEAQVEHDGAKALIIELQNGSPEDDYFDAKVKVLSEDIKHHVGEEEKPSEGIFAKAKEAGIATAEMAERLATRKQELMQEAQADALGPPETRSFRARNNAGRTTKTKENQMARGSSATMERERDDRGRFVSDDDDDRDYRHRSSSRGRYDPDDDDRRSGRSRDDEGRFTSTRSHRDDDDDRRYPRSRDDEGRFTSTRSRRDDYDDRRYSRARDDEGRFTSTRSHRDDDDDRRYSRARDDEGRFTSTRSHRDDDDDRRYSRARDDEGRFTSSRSRRDDDDDNGHRRGEGRGWYGDPEGHSRASREGWRRSDHEGSGWYGDPEGHSRASREGWDDRGGSTNSRARREDDDDRRYARARDDEGRFTSSQSRSRSDDDDDRGRGRGHGGWYGDPEGHAEAARQRRR